MTNQPYSDYEYPVDKGFGSRFKKAWRQSEYRDLNQEELGKIFDVHKSTISSWTRGVRTPSSEAVKDIAIKFKINPDWLYTGREPMRPGYIGPYTDIALRWMKLDPEIHKTVLFIIGLLERQVIAPKQLEDQVRELVSADM